MANELYENCPCGSGKKIKFCCPRELQSDFLKALELMNSNQRAMAVERCDRALAKAPGQSCFLMVKVAAQLQMGEVEASRQTWEQLHQSAPSSPVTRAFRVFFALDEGDVDAAVHHLQDAVEKTSNDAVPWLVRSAIEQTILSLLASGETFAFLQHAHHYDKTITQQPDQRILLTLKRACLDVNEELVFKQPWLDRLIALYPDPFRKPDVYRDLALFRWRRMRDRFAQWRKEGQYEPGATVYQALMHALLLENTEAAALLRQFASRSDVPELLAAESLLLALEIEPPENAAYCSIVREFTVTDSERLMERLLSDPRTRSQEVPSQYEDSDEPPPKAVFDVFDRPYNPDFSADIADMTQVIGVLFLHGRQTDREARIVFQGLDQDVQQTDGVLNELIGEFVAPEPTVAEENKVAGHVRLGPTMAGFGIGDAAEMRRFLDRYYDFTIREYWPNRPNPLLDGKTPNEAANDTSLRTGLLAALVLLENTPNFDIWEGDYVEFWRQFGLEHDLNSWSPRNAEVLWLNRLNPEPLDDSTLWSAFVYAAAMGVRRAAYRLGNAVLARPTLFARDELGELLRVIVDVTAPADKRLETVERAIEWCRSKGLSDGEFRVRQFVCLAVLQRTSEAAEILDKLTHNYRHEPATMQMLMQVLQEMGIVGPDGRISAPLEQPEPAAAASGLWTPDQASPAPAADKPSKIWLPGMD